jgi:hypothetical protein
MSEDAIRALLGQPVDQARELLAVPFAWAAIGAT